MAEYYHLYHLYYPSLVLVQPRKTSPCLTERLLMGLKESDQTNKQIPPLPTLARNIS